MLFGDQAIEPTLDSNPAGVAQAFPFANQTSGTVASISVYVDSHNRAGRLIAGLYADAGGHPGALLASGSLYSPRAGAWDTVSVPSASVRAGSSYWLALLSRRGALYFRDRAGGPCDSEGSAQTTLTSLPSSWTSGPRWNYCPVSAYVNGFLSTPPPPPPANTAPPQITGATTQGDALSTSNGSWNGSPTSYTYAWQDCDSSGAGCTNIGGAANNSYSLSSADVGHTIRAVVTATNAGGSASQSSAYVGPVQAAAVSSFVTACGTQLCLNGSPFVIKGATAYGQYGNASSEITTAKAAGINTLELVEFDDQYHVLSDTESAATWNRVDAFIAAAAAAHIHVILHLAEYGQSLQAAGYTMSSTATGAWPNLGWQADWNQYLQFVANRVNTVSGVIYKDDPTIAMVEVWGEIPAPNGDGGPPSCAATCWTTAQMQSFYSNTISEWRSLAPNILISSGGFSYLDDSSSGIPWQNVMSNPGNAACDAEINSYGDRDTTVPNITSYCKGLGKPWFLAAWSSCSNPNQGSWDINDWLADTPAHTDVAMAAHAQNMYAIAAGSSPATYPSVGADFWNLGTETYNTCDLGPSSPESNSQTWAVVKAATP